MCCVRWCEACSVPNVPSDEFTFDLDPESPWIGVKGGGLERPMAVRVRFSGVALQLVGVQIEGEDEITSATLRSVRLTQLLPALRTYLVHLVGELDKDVEFLSNTLTGMNELPDPKRLQAGPEWWGGVDEIFMDMLSVTAQRTAVLEQVQFDEGVEFQPRPRGAKPPTDEEYARFAAIYLEEVASGARGAKQRTADRVAMNRGTAYKWIRACEARGLLTPRGTA